MRGLFITLEGIDGAGKSTHLRKLAQRLRSLGYRVRATREPGGTKLGEAIRRLLVEREKLRIAPLAELALMYAARAEHMEEVIRPALARGDLVLSDRFNGASFAYQGYGRGLGSAVVAAFDHAVCGALQPDLTLILDLDPRIALARAHSRGMRKASSIPRRPGRFEQEGLPFLKRVRRGYLKLARANPARIKVVNATGEPREVEAQIQRAVERFLERRRAPKPATRKS
jgi:dTMP kinase